MPSLLKFKSSYGINIDYEPWFSSGYRLVNLKIREELGGSLASGSIRLTQVSDLKNLKLVTDQYTGMITITKSGNNNDEDVLFKFEIFIINRTYEKNSVLLDFYCISNKSFYTDLQSNSYKNITEALNSLYPKSPAEFGGRLGIDIRCDSDIANEISIVQFNETNHSLCTKLANSFKRKAIFAYGFNGFFIKDILGINSLTKDETKLDNLPKIINNLGTVREKSFMIPYNNILFQNIKEPWLEEKYSNLSSPYSTSFLLYDKYVTVGNSMTPLMENYVYNTTHFNTSLYSYSSIVTNTIPDYRLGDVITFVDEKEELTDKDTIKFPYKTFLICSNEFFITADSIKVSKNLSGMSWTSRIIGLEQFGKLFPEMDLTDSLTDTGSLPDSSQKS